MLKLLFGILTLIVAAAIGLGAVYIAHAYSEMWWGTYAYCVCCVAGYTTLMVGAVLVALYIKDLCVPEDD